MKKSHLIQIKAVFLLIVFSLNTVVGFACSVGVDMGFNGSHHKQEATPAHSDSHQHAKPHHEHKEATDAHHSSDDEKNNCCKDEVAKLVKVDKLTPKSFDFGIYPVFVAAFISTFYQFNIVPSDLHTPDNKFFVRSHHPPIPDIRVAIQSFQI
ncbi:hypothetical protein BCY91_06295 [Pelobium manganitolerans]|uniref:Uncharacterized protein n=1 Tax=Pelobium manganitolerans TaxID=1842495 RepID=A0A419S4U9_9SPHI|nr:hypothetical protein [Pelobium manganitolerans]RKD15128.1 hypothetical protein BCY91_06295 [Pelobium manganitolerans]